METWFYDSTPQENPEIYRATLHMTPYDSQHRVGFYDSTPKETPQSEAYTYCEL